MLYVLAQVFFVCALICYIIAVTRKQKLQLTIMLMSTNLFFCLHYLLLQKYGTLILLSFEIVLFLLIFLFEKYEKPQIYTVISCVIVMILDVVAIILTWTEAISLLPLSASLLFLFGLCFKGVLMTKIITLYTNLSYIIYLSLIQSYVSLGCQVILLMGAIVGLMITIKDLKTKKQIKQSRAIEPTILKKFKLKAITNNIENNFVLSNH